MISADRSMARAERVLRQIVLLREYKKRPKKGYRPPKGGKRALIKKLLSYLDQTEKAIELARDRDRIAKKHWITIACEVCLRPLMRVDPKGPILQQKLKFFCWRCDGGKKERRTNDGRF